MRERKEAARVPGTDLRVAGIGARVVASFVDGIAFFPVNLLLASQLDGTAQWAAGVTCDFLFVVGFWVWRGQTPGKMLLRIRVCMMADGALPSPSIASIRWLVLFGVGAALGLASGPVQILSFLWTLALLISMMTDRLELNRGWHDLVAGTVVVVA